MFVFLYEFASKRPFLISIDIPSSYYYLILLQREMFSLKIDDYIILKISSALTYLKDKKEKNIN